MNRVKDAHENFMWEVHLGLIGDKDNEIDELPEQLRKEFSWMTG